MGGPKEVSGIFHPYMKITTVTCVVLINALKIVQGECLFWSNMSGQKVKKSSKDDVAANGSVSATMQKAFKKNSTWEDKVFTQC